MDANNRSLISSFCSPTSICTFHHCYLCQKRQVATSYWFMVSVRLSSYGARRVWRAQEKHKVVRGAALKSSPNFSRVFFCDSIDAQLIKAGTNSLMVQNKPFQVSGAILDWGQTRLEIQRMYWILADFEPWYLLLNLTHFASETFSKRHLN